MREENRQAIEALGVSVLWYNWKQGFHEPHDDRSKFYENLYPTQWASVVEVDLSTLCPQEALRALERAPFDNRAWLTFGAALDWCDPRGEARALLDKQALEIRRSRGCFDCVENGERSDAMTAGSWAEMLIKEPERVAGVVPVKDRIGGPVGYKPQRYIEWPDGSGSYIFKTGPVSSPNFACMFRGLPSRCTWNDLSPMPWSFEK